MASQLLFTSVVAAFVLIISWILYRLQPSQPHQNEKEANHEDFKEESTEMTELRQRLTSAIPDSVILPQDSAAFNQSMNSYWAQQECEVVPACVVRPQSVQELGTAVTILKSENDRRSKQATNEGFFAVRGGGHSPVSGAASINGGVMIDLSLFREVTPSKDGSCVIIGAGAKWKDVSKVLDEKGLAVVGGRNSAVGVGGLTLGGGLSFFSPRFGFVCSNVICYEIVLAPGSVTTASASNNPELWRALKGGSNNFGIVTRFTVRCFPCSKIWSGFLYLPSFQVPKVLAAFHEFVDRNDKDDLRYDENAAGPIACFSYIQALGMQAIAINLVHTQPLENENQWPSCWKTSSFPLLWRLWSTCEIRTLTSATDEMNALNLPGRRQVFATTTVMNDRATLHAVHAAYHQAIASLRRTNIKGLVWTLVLQPLLPAWTCKGDPNPLGLLSHEDTTDKPLVMVSFTVNWDERRDDGVVKQTTRRTVEEIDACARANGTAHSFRYLNYCADWQRPFEGYGEENWRFLREVGRKYDPDELFQTGCVGGFKLDIGNSELRDRH